MLQRCSCTGRSSLRFRQAAAGLPPCGTRAAPAGGAHSCLCLLRHRRCLLGGRAYAAPNELLRDTASEELRALLSTALRSQCSLPRDAEQLLLSAALDVCNSLGEQRGVLSSPDDVIRGLLRWQTLTGLAPDVLAEHAVEHEEFLALPTETIVSFVFLLRELMPNADLTRVLSALPLGALLRGEAGEHDAQQVTSLRYCAGGALAELRQIMPEPIVQLLAEQSPMLLFGDLGIADLLRLRDAWQASGSAQLSGGELATAMRDPRFVRYFVNFVL